VGSASLPKRRRPRWAGSSAAAATTPPTHPSPPPQRNCEQTHSAPVGPLRQRCLLSCACRPVLEGMERTLATRHLPNLQFHWPQQWRKWATAGHHLAWWADERKPGIDWGAAPGPRRRGPCRCSSRPCQQTVPTPPPSAPQTRGPSRVPRSRPRAIATGTEAYAAPAPGDGTGAADSERGMRGCCCRSALGHCARHAPPPAAAPPAVDGRTLSSPTPRALSPVGATERAERTVGTRAPFRRPDRRRATAAALCTHPHIRQLAKIDATASQQRGRGPVAFRPTAVAVGAVLLVMPSVGQHVTRHATQTLTAPLRRQQRDGRHGSGHERQNQAHHHAGFTECRRPRHRGGHGVARWKKRAKISSAAPQAANTRRNGGGWRAGAGG